MDLFDVRFDILWSSSPSILPNRKLRRADRVNLNVETQHFANKRFRIEAIRQSRNAARQHAINEVDAQSLSFEF